MAAHSALTEHMVAHCIWDETDTVTITVPGVRE